MPDTRPLISLVVPTYMEEMNVQAFYNELLKATADVDFDLEVLFMDDGSTDNTFAELSKVAAMDKRIRVLRLSRNFGSYSAITAGFHQARGDAVIAMSIDLQDPPALIPQFVAKWREGFDIVWGVRADRSDPFLKSLYARIFYAIIRRFAFEDFPEDGMDTGLFDRRVIDIYRTLPERNSIPFITIFSLGFRQFRIPYARMARRAGVSKWPFWKRVKAAIDVLVNFSYAPIRLISLFGLGSSAFAFLLMVIVILNRLLFNIGAPGWPSTIVVVLFFGSIQMLMLGIIAEYVWRSSEQARARPRYIIMEEVNRPSDTQHPKPNPLAPSDLYVADYQETVRSHRGE